LATRSKTSPWQSDLTVWPQKRSLQKTPRSEHRGRWRKSSQHSKQFRRHLSPELLTQIRAESHGRAYVQKQIRKKTPMVFELYGEHIEGIISRRLTYALAVVSVNEEVHHLEKLNIKYMYKQDEMSQVVQDIEVDAGLKAQNLISIVHKSERFQVDDRVLVRCCKKKIPVRLTLRGGEIITGVIRWFSQYDMKMLLAHGGNVIVFRHGLHRFEIGPQWA
jgi:sRNA-binding regulator protein Hfq